jgi:hypothetical protein
MKNIKKLLSFASVAALLAAGSGCAKISDFGTTNINPNGSATGGTRAGIYAQLISETQYTDVSLYQLPQLDEGPFYSGALMDLQVIINQNTDPKTAGAASASGSNANQIAIAKILKSWIIWTLTDKWGDLPYSEALQGAANKSPKYDTQEDIYKAIFKDCRDAVAGFDAGGPIKGDVIYAGNTAKWQKLANSIRMLAAMRLTKVYPSPTDYPALEYKAAATDPAGYIATNADNFTLAFPGGAYKNTWNITYDVNQRSDYAESRTVGDVLNALGDSRSTVFGSNPGATFPYGLLRTDAIAYDNSTSSLYAKVLAAPFRTENAATVLLPSSLVLLSLAEATERGWIALASAQSYYDAGVTASFAQWGLAVPAGYLTSGPANYNTGAGAPGNVGVFTPPSGAGVNLPPTQNAATPDKLSRIALQYWLAAFPNGNEAWANWRRTGVPNLQPTKFKTNSGGIPRRYVYGVSDYSLNPAQLAVAVGRLAGGDTQDSRVWWDKP